MEYAPSSRRIAFAVASASGASSFAMSAATSSVSDVVASLTPAARSSSRSSPTLMRLPLCPSATVRARPWWSCGCAFAQADEPVVE